MINHSIFFAIHLNAPIAIRVFENKLKKPGNREITRPGRFETKELLSTSGPQIPEITNQNGGEIETILFSFLSFPHFGKSERTDAYQSVIRELRVGTKFIIKYCGKDTEVIGDRILSVRHSSVSISWVHITS